MGAVVYRQGEVSESERGERGRGRGGRGREEENTNPGVTSKPYVPRTAVEVDTLGLIPPNSNDRYPYSFS